MIEIRSLALADVPVLYELIGELADYERLRPEMKCTPERLAATLFNVDGQLNAGGPHAVLAWEGSVAQGFMLWTWQYSTFLGARTLFLEDIYVRSSERAKGTGKKLMKHLARTAMREGCSRIEWSVLRWNEPAIRFYQKLGAVPKTAWTGFRLADEALVQLAGARDSVF